MYELHISAEIPGRLKLNLDTRTSRAMILKVGRYQYTVDIYVEGGEGVEWEQLCKICQAESGMTNFT